MLQAVVKTKIQSIKNNGLLQDFSSHLGGAEEVTWKVQNRVSVLPGWNF